MSIDKIKTGDDLTQSLDIVSDNISKLKELFPEALTEGKIDFKVLQDILGNEIEEEEEFYRFTWAGKSQSRREAHKPSTGTLRPCKEESVDWDTTQNLYIEGDNLEVLKLLQKSYSNKVKMIYIDPPYNTGKDFVYKDNYKDNLKNYQQITGQVDDEGNKTSTNSESDGRYHSNWLNMMYPRLRLSRNLLKEDGVIFMSIDDNELENLIKLCNEIFGEECFLNLINIKAKDSSGASGGGEDKRLKKNIEYLLCYTKTTKFEKFNDIFIEQDLVSYIEERKINNKSFAYTKVLYDDGVETFVGKIKAGNGDDIELFTCSDYVVKSINQICKEEMISLSQAYFKYYDKIFTTENAQTSIRDRVKNALPEFDGIINTYYTPISGRNKGVKTKVSFEGSTKRLVSYLSNVSLKVGDKIIKKDKIGTLWNDLSWSSVSNEGDVPYPSGKKPISLIKRCLELVKMDNNEIVLDFFSGSNSTYHSVIDFNVNTNSKLTSINVQLPDKISLSDLKDYYSKNGFEHFKYITDIGKERAKRVGNKIREENPLSHNNFDLGFKVFKLDTSNIKGWDGLPDNLEKSLFDSQDNIKSDRKEEDVLFEILLKYGLDLTLPIEEKVIEGKKVFNVGFGALFICLGNEITSKVAEGIGLWKETLKPETCRVIFKDGGFTDVEKTNSVQTLKRFGIQEIKSI